MDEFRHAQSGMRGTGVRGWWERLPEALTDDQRDMLMRAAADPTISHRAIVIVLGQWGLTVTMAQVGHWRRTYVR